MKKTEKGTAGGPPPDLTGQLLHTKHAFPPNNLGYCGPDVRGKIQDYLHHHSDSEELRSLLTKFEAAYPFVRMIAKSTGRMPLDYEVAEAYWLGNALLDEVQPADFFEFTYQELASSRRTADKKDGLGKPEAKWLFQKLGPTAKPHHTFYVLGMYSRSSEKVGGAEAKLLELMDSCRISWGRVLEVKRDSLVVDRPPLILGDGKLSLGPVTKKKVGFDPEIPPFSSVQKGDWVSLHWNFASEKLQRYQLENLRRYTALDIEAANKLVTLPAKECPFTQAPH